MLTKARIPAVKNLNRVEEKYENTRQCYVGLIYNVKLLLSQKHGRPKYRTIEDR